MNQVAIPKYNILSNNKNKRENETKTLSPCFTSDKIIL